MSMNVVTLTYNLNPNEDTLIDWAEMLEPFDGTVSAIPDRGVVDVVVWVDEDLFKAPIVAADLANPLVGAEPIAMLVVSESEYERLADSPTLPRMVSAPEVAELLGGITRQRVHQLRSLAAFPAPLVELRTGPIWDAEAIEKFEREWERKAGRPAKSTYEDRGKALVVTKSGSGTTFTETRVVASGGRVARKSAFELRKNQIAGRKKR